MRIDVQDLNVPDRNYTARMQSTATVGDLKSLLAMRRVEGPLTHQEGPSEDEQILTFNGQRLLDDNALLESFGIRDGSNVQMDTKVIVNIKLPRGHGGGKRGACMEIKVFPEATLREVQQLVQDRTGIAIDQQVIYSGTKKYGPDDALPTYRGAGTLGGGRRMEISFDLRVKQDTPLVSVTIKHQLGGYDAVLVESTATVGDLKRAYAERVGPPAHQQQLGFDSNRPFDDDNRTLASYIIGGDGTVHDGIKVRLISPVWTSYVGSERIYSTPSSQPAPSDSTRQSHTTRQSRAILPNRAHYLLIGAGVGALVGALSGTAIVVVCGYTIEDQIVAIVVPTAVCALIGTFVGELLFRRANAGHESSATVTA